MIFGAKQTSWCEDHKCCSGDENHAGVDWEVQLRVREWGKNCVLGCPSNLPTTADVVRSWVESGVKFWSACSVGRRSFLRPEVEMLLNNMPLDW